MLDEIIDNSSIHKHHADITYHGGNSFTGYSQLAAVGILIMGIVMILSLSPAGLIIGSVFIISALFGLTSSYGTEICIETGYVREYNKRFFIKTGKWFPSNLFTDICILKIGRSVKRSDISGSVSTDIDASKNEIYLMSSNHRKRFLLKTCKSFQEASQAAEQLSLLFNKPIKPFNPQISQATQDRKRLRR